MAARFFCFFALCLLLGPLATRAEGETPGASQAVPPMLGTPESSGTGAPAERVFEFRNQAVPPVRTTPGAAPAGTQTQPAQAGPSGARDQPAAHSIPAENVPNRPATLQSDPAGPQTDPGMPPAPLPAAEPAAPAVSAPETKAEPFALPQRSVEIPQRFGLGIYPAGRLPDDLLRVKETVRAAAREWHAPMIYLAWYAPGKRPGQGIGLFAWTDNGGADISVRRPGDEDEAVDLERRLAYPVSPAEIAEIYLANEVVADDDFKGRPVLFQSEVADIARGAFGKPYVFFPAQPGGVTGLTCYFDDKDPALRKLRKGSKVTVRAVVKGFLMQDVILDKCVLVDIHQAQAPNTSSAQ